MRAAGLLPLLLLLLGVSSQDDADPGQITTAASKETITVTTPASSAQISPANPAPSPTTTQATSTTTAKESTAQATVATTAQSTTTTTTDPGTSSSPTAKSPTTVAGTTRTVLGTTSTNTTTTTSPHTSGQGSPSHSTTTPTATPAASSTTSQQPTSATASSGGSGTTALTKPVLANATSPPGAVGTVATSSPSTQPQGKQPSDHLPSTTVSTTVPRTDPSQSSKECGVPPPPCVTKQPPSSSSSPVHKPTPSTSPRSTGTSVTAPTGSPSLTTTPTSQPRSKDTVPEAATTTAPGADQSTHEVGSASAKPTRASQSPARAQTSAPAVGNQTDSCSPGHQHPNVSFPNELNCNDQVQHTGPTIYLKEPRTCDEWRTASKNISFFESFCSTAQHVFDTSRDTCTVTLTACEPRSHHWDVRVVLHRPLDTEEIFKGLKEKEKLEELGIVNITSDKMVEDMTINDEFSTPLIITIITLAGSLLLIAAIYGCHQRFSQRKDQNIHPDVPGFDDGHVALIFNQRLTEEMQTMENGYHDNPTLEVMETSSEMQEKKVNLNGELGDSWIVPLDTLTKEDLEEEEDTHL